MMGIGPTDRDELGDRMPRGRILSRLRAHWLGHYGELAKEVLPGEGETYLIINDRNVGG